MNKALKKIALASLAAAGLIATTTAASADWYGRYHHRHHYRDRASISLSFGSPYGYVGYNNYGNRYYGGYREYGRYGGSDGMGGSYGYDPRYGGVIHCDRFHHWAGNHCNANY